MTGGLVAPTISASGAISAGSTISASGAISAGSTISASGAISAGSTIYASGAISAGSTISASGAISAGSTIYASGAISTGAGSDIVAGHRLRGSYGAYGSGDSAAACLLGDFTNYWPSVNDGYTVLPNGVWDQTFQAGVYAVNGLLTTVYTIPTAFPNYILDAIICFYGNLPPLGGSVAIQPFSRSQVSITTNYTTTATFGCVVRARGE
jgi:hypothetical protein